jgi:trans-aconitate 2-methyltransferase
MNAATDQSPEQYLLFEQERTRPLRDLLSVVPTAQVRVAIDIGCGPGNSTEALLTHVPRATLSGVDKSTAMIAAARERLPQLQFEVADIAHWDAPGPFDLILANAVLQWVPQHEVLFPKLVGKLSPGGTLAVQMPDNLDEPVHRLMREIAAAGPWAARLKDAARTLRHEPAWYYALLESRCTRVDVWRTVYFHPLAAGADGVVEWFKGTALRPFLAALDEAEGDAFLRRYRDAVADACPALPDGTLLLPFPRLFIAATR